MEKISKEEKREKVQNFMSLGFGEKILCLVGNILKDIKKSEEDEVGIVYIERKKLLNGRRG